MAVQVQKLHAEPVKRANVDRVRHVRAERGGDSLRHLLRRFVAERQRENLVRVCPAFLEKKLNPPHHRRCLPRSRPRVDDRRRADPAGSRQLRLRERHVFPARARLRSAERGGV